MSMSLEQIIEVDSRSVYVGNVDYGVALEELYQFFAKCGPMNRVTILCTKPDGHPKGFAYIEFENKESVQRALTMDMSFLRGRQIKVKPKRTNQPGLSSTHRPPRMMPMPMWGPGRGGVGAPSVVPGTIEYPGGYNAVYFNYYG